MKVEKIHDGIRYTLSNDNLVVGDKVFPIAMGRCTEDGTWILHGFDFKDITSGFPHEPHTIQDLNHSDYKPYQTRTEFGYGPIEIYFKIVKREKQIKVDGKGIFSTYSWVEI